MPVSGWEPMREYLRHFRGLRHALIASSVPEFGTQS